MKRASALILLAATSACATAKPVVDNKLVPTHADTHEITVAESRERLELPVKAALPSDGQLAEIDAFGRLYRTLGEGALLLETPPDSDLARGLAAQVRARLIEGGVNFAAVANAVRNPENGESAPPESLRLSFARYTAKAPDCPTVNEANLSWQHDNQAYKSFGCANAVNLAAMVANPADLAGPRAMDPRDGARRTTVFQKYREGKPSGAERSADERATTRQTAQ